MIAAAGLSPEQLVLHPGVVERDGRFHDHATRRTLVDDVTYTGSPRRDEIILAHRLGRFRVARRQIPELLFAAVLRTPRIGPWRVLGSTFRRRYPATTVGVVWEVAAASALPTAIMFLGFLALGGTVSLLVGSADVVLIAAVVGTLVCSSSLIVHESAHLIVMRAAERDMTVGAVEHSWLNVWIVGPTLRGWSRRLTALAGPVAGLAAVSTASLLGSPRWICVCLGFVHAVNLLPIAPDGELLLQRDRPDDSWSRVRGHTGAAGDHEAHGPTAAPTE
jgi:hypothetical protein